MNTTDSCQQVTLRASTFAFITASVAFSLLVWSLVTSAPQLSDIIDPPEIGMSIPDSNEKSFPHMYHFKRWKQIDNLMPFLALTWAGVSAAVGLITKRRYPDADKGAVGLSAGLAPLPLAVISWIMS